MSFVHKQVVAGRMYNTETAIKIGEVGSSIRDSGDFGYWTGTLYKTRRGAFFVAGHGGARSMFARSEGNGWWSGGSGIRLLDSHEALAMAEANLDAPTIAEHFDITDG